MRAIIIILILSVVTGYSQVSHRIELTVKGNPTNKIYLSSLNCHNTQVIDSSEINSNGEFIFKLSNNFQPGLYKITLGMTEYAKFYNEPPRFINIIFNHEDIKLATDFESPIDSMVIIESKENAIYYDYLKLKDKVNKKLELLEQLLKRYPEKDKFYNSIQDEYNRLQTDILKFADSTNKKHPEYITSRLINADKFPFIDGRLNAEERIERLKTNFFSASLFSDTILLHTNIISEKILSFLSLYSNSAKNKEEQSADYIRATDIIISNAQSGDPIVFKYVINYLIEGFTEIRQEAVLAYITDNYLTENSCNIDSKTLEKLQKKSSDYKRTVIGVSAPEISFSDTLNLSGIKSAYTLIIFWASWCPHCTSILPQIRDELYKYNSDQIQVISISLDEDTLTWVQSLAQYVNLEWINYCEFKKWDSPSSRLYNITATPSMFLLDGKKTIISKPSTFLELLQELGKLF